MLIILLLIKDENLKYMIPEISGDFFCINLNTMGTSCKRFENAPRIGLETLKKNINHDEKKGCYPAV